MFKKFHDPNEPARILPVEASIVALLKSVPEIPMSNEEALLLLWRYREEGCIASRNKIVEGNMRWIVKLCRDMTHGDGVMVSDLIPAATIGYIQGLDSFNPDHQGYEGRTTKINSHCTNWMRKRIYEYLDEQSTPYKTSDRVIKYAKKAKKQAERELASSEFDVPVDTLMADVSSRIRCGAVEVLSRHRVMTDSVEDLADAVAELGPDPMLQLSEMCACLDEDDRTMLYSRLNFHGFPDFQELCLSLGITVKQGDKKIRGIMGYIKAGGGLKKVPEPLARPMTTERSVMLLCGCIEDEECEGLWQHPTLRFSFYDTGEGTLLMQVNSKIDLGTIPLTRDAVKQVIIAFNPIPQKMKITPVAVGVQGVMF